MARTPLTERGARVGTRWKVQRPLYQNGANCTTRPTESIVPHYGLLVARAPALEPEGTRLG